MYFGQTRPMEVYDRQIRYLDYMENGLRTRGAGFVKLERQDNQCNISLQVSGLYRKDRFTRPFLLLDEQGERELRRLQLADGGIKLYLDHLDCNNLDGQGLKYEQLRGFRIPISEGKEIRCMLGAREVARPVAKPEFIPLRDMVPQIEVSAIEMPTIEMPMLETPIVEEPMMEMDTPMIKAPVIETLQAEKKQSSADEVFARVQDLESKTSSATTAIKDDKWEQLWTIYPHKCPFSDDREYLSLGPSDLVILSEKHYKLVSNSFLLHGYYNYKHLILTRIRERSQTRFYIGVPGIFMEREKRTAIMFGFKSFECAVEPAENGDFGYYMIPVEL